VPIRCWRLSRIRENGVPMHVHDNEEEHFIILEGKRSSQMETVERRSCRFVRHHRQGVAHAWCNPSEDALLRMLVLFTPGGLEELCPKKCRN